MDAIEAILSRRSIRKYTSEQVSSEDIGIMLKAAMAAPSARDAQPWHFIVIDDHRILDTIPETHPNASMLFEAQLAIAVCGDSQYQPGWWMVDCAAAAQNLLLAAHAIGLGAVWIGFYPVAARMRELQGLVGLPSHILPLALIALGHPGEKKELLNRYDSGKIHRNYWRI